MKTYYKLQCYTRKWNIKHKISDVHV